MAVCDVNIWPQSPKRGLILKYLLYIFADLISSRFLLRSETNRESDFKCFPSKYLRSTCACLCQSVRLSVGTLSRYPHLVIHFPIFIFILQSSTFCSMVFALPIIIATAAWKGISWDMVNKSYSSAAASMAPQPRATRAFRTRCARGSSKTWRRSAMPC